MGYEQRLSACLRVILILNLLLPFGAQAEDNGKAGLSQAELFQSLVIFEGSDGESGSGFIATLRDRTFLVTNIHVLAMSEDLKATTVEGVEVPIGQQAFLSKDRDLAIIALPDWDGYSLEVASNLLNGQYPIGSAVNVYGNEGGGGVVTTLEGDIKGIGPVSVEVTAEFIPGNSGSPVIHKESGKVIGIASYLREALDTLKIEAPKETDKEGGAEAVGRFSNMRRFAYRMDGKVEWQGMDTRSLAREAALFSEYEERTYALADIIYYLTERKEVLTSYNTHPTIGRMMSKLDKSYDWTRGFNSANNLRLIENFRVDLLKELNKDEISVRSMTSSFYVEQALALQRFRQYMYDLLKKHQF